MKFLQSLVNHPHTGKPDIFRCVVGVAVLLCSIKFLLEGVQFTFDGHTFTFGHADPLAYGTLLTPVLGAHGAQEWKATSLLIANNTEGSANVDNPDV